MPLEPTEVPAIQRGRGLPAIRTPRRLSQIFLYLCESPRQTREFRYLDCAQLQVQKGRQARRDSRVNFAGIDIRDQPGHRIPHGKRIVQGRQRIRAVAGSMSIAPAPDPA